MKLFLQVEINRFHQGGFGNLMLKYASSLSSDMMGTDLDSQSDPIIADLVIRMIHQAESVFLLVQSNDPNLPPGVAKRVLDTLFELPHKVSYAVLCGDHRTSESVMASFHPHFFKESDEERIKEMIRDFSG